MERLLRRSNRVSAAGRRRRAYLAALAVSVAFAASACTGSSPCRFEVPRALRERCDVARRLEEQGRDDEALVLYREIVAAEPRLVAARRALQNLEIAQHRRGELLVVQRARLAQQPRAAEEWYLWGRLLASAAEQRVAFEHANDLDPDCPWPWLGLGALDLAAGDVRSAIARLRRGRDAAPDLRELELALLRAQLAEPAHLAEVERLLTGVLDAEPWDVERVMLLADLRVRQERSREAIEILGRLLARVPRNREVAAALLQRFERDGTIDDARWLVHELEPAAREPAVVVLLARCHAMRGDGDAALHAWAALSDLSAEERSWRRMLRVLRGDLERMVAEEAPRFDAIAQLGFRNDAWDALARAVAAPPDERPDAVAQATLLAEVGWTEEAIAVLRPAARDDARADAASELLARLFAQRQLEAEVRVLALESYRAFESRRALQDFDAFLQRVGAASRRALGLDLVEASPRLEFWPVGEMLDPGSSSGLVGWFRRHGRLLLTGQRRGRPSELMLAPILARGTAGPQDAALSLIEGTLIPGWLEHAGARFAGAALDRFVYVDVAAVEDDVMRILALERGLGAERDRVLADPVLAAADRSQRISVAEPAEVATKLELRALDLWRASDPAASRATFLAEALEGVLAHEIGHLEDARRFLPISSRLWSYFDELIRLRFSPRRIEQWLEMRAACVALARARNPYLVLSGCIGQLGGVRTLTPHGGGYQELLARLVAAIDAAPEEFPALDRSKVLLQQLDRLSPEEIRVLARRVLQDLGID